MEFDVLFDHSSDTLYNNNNNNNIRTETTLSVTPGEVAREKEGDH
jgi:hypothetical protein